MDCKYIKNHDLHEKYLLNKLEEEEKQQYKKHLLECKNCTAELEKQRLIIMGIRQIGRKEMKLEISRQVAEKRSQKKQYNWTLVLKIAAVILFVVIAPSMIYYYQNWGPSTYEIGRRKQIQPRSDIRAQEEIIKEKQEGDILFEEPRMEDAKSKRNASKIKISPAPLTREKKEIASSKLRIDVEEKSVGEGIVAKKSIPPISSKMGKSRRGFEEESVISDELIPTESEKTGEDGFLSLRKKSVLQNNYRYNAISTPSIAQNKKESPTLHSKSERKPKSSKQVQMQFSTGIKNINIFLEPVLPDLKKDSVSQLPFSFPVNIVGEDSTNIDMIWQVDPEFLRIDPHQISIQRPDTTTIQINIQNQYDYRINLKSKNTQAILQK